MSTTKITSPLAGILRDARRTKRYSAGITAMSERSGDFPSKTAMELTGLAIVHEARAMAESRLDEYWASKRAGSVDSRTGEVIIGAGFHAAVYAAARVAAGFPKPVVLERSARVGGAFAMSRGPSFYLNSYNRPGLLGAPSKADKITGEALNVIPGALIQPANLSGSEFQSNDDLAFVIRLTLAQFADVYTSASVIGVGRDTSGDYPNRLRLSIAGDYVTYPKRVLDARGLGDESLPGNVTTSPSVVTFSQLMAGMDSPSPLRGYKRVAVIGGGDSGKCAVESLLGIGPNGAMNAAALDYVQRIDWFALGLPSRTKDWRKYGQGQRGRYQRIGSYLPRMFAEQGDARLTVINETAAIQPGLGCAIVNGRTYDHVIVCAGYNLPALAPDLNMTDVGDARYVLARRGENVRPVYQRYYKIGPAAEIPFSTGERIAGISAISANQVGMFRLANRTAALAAMLKSEEN